MSVVVSKRGQSKFDTVIKSQKVTEHIFLITQNEKIFKLSHKVLIERINYHAEQTITTVEQFKTWLSTHNTTVYYVLATPTFTEITDETLIEQLENWRDSKSYNGQTNISQTNDDKAFIISYTTLKDVYSELDSRLKALEG